MYHFCLLCACVNEPVLVFPSMLPVDKMGNSEHARTSIIWYYRACSHLQKSYRLRAYQSLHQKWMTGACSEQHTLAFMSMLAPTNTYVVRCPKMVAVCILRCAEHAYQNRVALCIHRCAEHSYQNRVALCILRCAEHSYQNRVALCILQCTEQVYRK